MKLNGNTVLITGGGSGIGRGLAEALHRLDNRVIISGRRNGHLAATLDANPGMRSVELDVTDPSNIAAVTKKLIAEFPKLNVLINNAGVMMPDDAAGAMDDKLVVSTVATNLLGPIRMTSAVIEHFKKQPYAAVVNMSSVLGFVPLAMTAVYSSTKAAMHSYTLSLRFRLRGTSVQVQEMAPPWVRTDLMNSNNAPQAMPLKQFIEETMKALGTDAEEVLVESAKALRNNPGASKHALVTQFNDAMVRNLSP